MAKRNTQALDGFTVVELVVIIAVIAILATVTVVIYGTWQAETNRTVVKSDVTAAAAALDNAANFGGTYPASAASVFEASDGVTIAGGAIGSSDYCVSATKNDVSYFVTKNKLVLPGTCPEMYFNPSNHASFEGLSTGIKNTSGTSGYDAIFRDGTTDNVVGPVLNSEVGGAMRFDGTDKYYVPGTVTFGPNATWTACVKMISSINSFNMFMGRQLPYFGTQGANIIFSNSISGTQRSVVTTGVAFVPNAWYCLAFTTSYNGSQTTMKAYINGIERASGTFAGVQTEVPFKFTVGDGRQDMMWYPFNGLVSDVSVYKRTLSPGEIKHIFESLQPKFGI